MLAIAVAAGWAAATTPYRASGPAIRSDGSGYHAWVRAIVTADLSFCGDEELVRVKAISAVDPERGICQNKYPPGMALLRLPVAGWLVDRGAEDPRPSGTEHTASRWLSAVTLVATAGLVADAARRLRAGPGSSAVVLLCGTFGTGLFHYATYDGSFSHGSSALLVAGLAWVGIRAARAGRPPPVAATLVLTALLTLTRNTNVLVIGSLTVGWLVWRRWAPGRAPRVARVVLPAAAGVALGLAVQLAYNRYATGTWALSSYGTEPFVLDRRRQAAVVASYERGLLTWYPVLAVGSVALLLTATGRRLAALVLLLAGPLVVLYGFWHSWFLGGGFGHRGFVEIVPVVLVAFAVGVHQLGRGARRLVGSAMVVAALVTVSLMAGYWRGSIRFIGTGEEAYWAHVVGDESLYRP